MTVPRLLSENVSHCSECPFQNDAGDGEQVAGRRAAAQRIGAALQEVIVEVRGLQQVLSANITFLSLANRKVS